LGSTASSETVILSEAKHPPANRNLAAAILFSLYRIRRIAIHGAASQTFLCEAVASNTAASEVRPMIKKVSGGYKVLSSKGKNLGGPYKSRREAEKRLRQVEFFKRHK
jgi:hypothetical protein